MLTSEITIAMDRFLNASTGEDALKSLQVLLSSGEVPSLPEIVEEEPEFLEHLLHVLQLHELKSHASSGSNTTTLPPELWTTALELFQHWWSTSPEEKSAVLQHPQPGRVLETWLDVATTTTSGSGSGGDDSATTTALPLYIRVQAWQFLGDLLSSPKSSSMSSSTTSSSMVVEQWLQAPNGIHRLVQALAPPTSTTTNHDPAEEALWMQALAVAQGLAQTSPAICKILIFSEVETLLLNTIWHVYGGLTQGNPYVWDALFLIHTCLEQISNETSLLQLIWEERPIVAQRLTHLLDLRGGHAFLHPEEYTNTTMAANQNKNKKKSNKNKAKVGPLSRHKNRNTNDDDDDDDEDDDDDDLDALLQVATKTKASDASATTKTTSSQVDEDQHWPYLLESEEAVVTLVLKILSVMMMMDDDDDKPQEEQSSFRERIWTHFAPSLTSFVWELGLVVPFPPGSKAFFALVSSQLQRQALELMATHFSSVEVMTKMNGLDRLLEVVCTGGGMAHDLSERLACSQAALTVLRNTLTATQIHPLLLHTLAPPPTPEGPDDGNENDTPKKDIPPPPTVVQKLWNTVAEHLKNHPQSNATSTTKKERNDRTLFVSGALGALSLFCIDVESREMMVQSTPPAATLEDMLEFLSVGATTTTTSNEENDQIRIYAVFRFLLQYIHATPSLVQSLLSSPASIHLATLASTTNSSDNDMVAPLTLLLLGLSLEYFPKTQEECGGWTRASLLQVFQGSSWTIPKATKAMQGFLEAQGIELGFGCDLEVKYWKDWYRTAVMTVRKRLVLEMAGNGGSMEDGNDDEAAAEDASLTTQKIKPLQAMIAQQSAEMEELRTKLHQANAKLASQDHQLETWTRRTQSNPTQLDAMLNELTATTASLQEEINLLQSKAKEQDAQHGAQLALVQQELQDQRDETTKLRTEAEQTQEDRDRMEQELAALSQAYASLEEEYRRSTTTSITGSATSSGPTGGSTEVATLRAENERLKASSKEADEWMSQAYGKLSELGTQNQTLEQQVKALQDQLTNTAIQQEQGQREEIQRLQEQLAASQAEVATLQEQATTSHEQWTQAYNGLEQTKLALEQQIQALSSSKDDANTARIQELEAVIEGQNQKVHGLQTALEEAQQAVVSPPPVDSTQQVSDERGDAQMKQQLDTAREELQSVRSRLEEELYKKELMIREMESRLSSGLGSYTVNDIQERDNEIEELRAANEAAQDWMGKAVEQHRSLQQKLVTATTEGMRSSFSIVDTTELEALKKEISVEKASHEETRQQVDSLRQALEDAYQERQSMARDLSNAADQSREQSSKFENHIADLKSQMSQQEARANATIAQWQESHAEELTRCRELRQEVESLKKQISALTATNQPAEVVEKSAPTSAADFFGAGESSPLPPAPAPSTAELTEELRKIEVELHEAKSAIQGDDDVIRQWQDRVTDLEAEVERLNTQAKEQEDEANEAIFKWQDAHAALERDLALAVDGDHAARYQDEIHRLNERVKELEAELARASSGADALVSEEQTAKLLSEIEQLKETQNAMELEAREAIARWEEEYNTIVKERDDLLESHEKTETASISSVIVDRVEELQAEIERLTAQDEDATEAIAQWQEAHASLEAELERVNGQLDERTKEWEETKINLEQGMDTMTTGSERESRAKELEAEVNRLLEQNAKLQTELGEATSVVLESPDSFAEIQSIRESRDESEQRCAALSRELEKILEEKATLETKALENTQIQGDLEAARKEIAEVQAESQNIIQQWSDRVVELEEQLTDLQSNMSTQEKEASSVISSWETQCTELQDQLARLQDQLEARNEDQGSDELRKELETLQAESSTVIQQWHDRVNELETQMSDMQLTMEQQEAEASQAIAAWETKVSELQLELSELEIQITKPRKENGELRGELEATREELDSVRESASAAEAKWRDRVDELEEQLADMRVTVQQQQGDASQAIGKLARLEDQVETLQTELATNSQKVEAMNELEASLDALQQESSMVVAQWSERVAELEGQVAELESSLEQQETEVSEVIVSWEQKVSELDEELVDMESKLATTQRDSAATIQQLEAELQAARANYESSKVTSERLSIEKNRLDLELDNLKENRDELQADLQVSTVGQLRQALYRSIDELQKSRHSERLASEQLAKLRLEMAVSEQEIISAKAEIRFLSDALEDLRIKEAKKRENLEYHIGSFLQEVNHEVTLHREEQNQHENDGSSSSGNPLLGDDDASEDTMAMDVRPSSGVASAAE